MELNQALAAIFREVDKGLKATSVKVLSEKNLKPQKLQVTLKVQFLEHKPLSPGGPQVVVRTEDQPDTSSDGSCHSITLEFSSPSSGKGDDAVVSYLPEEVVIADEPVTLEVLDANQLQSSFAEVFGTPGFNSSARAAVFREALLNLSDAEAREVMEALKHGSIPENEEVKRAQHLILNVIRSGPLKSPTRAGKVLSPIFSQYPPTSLLEFIKNAWKTQEDWMDHQAGRIENP